MIPLSLLTLAPFVAKDAGLAWNFDGTIKAGAGRYSLVGKEFCGEVAWYMAPKGSFSAEKIYGSDTARTKEADEAKSFSHHRIATLLAGMPAIRSDQLYLWKDVPVASTCVYCADGGRAWVVRLWWPPASNGQKAAEAFLKGVRRSSS